MSHMMKASALKKCGSTNRNENYPTPTPLVRKMVQQTVKTAHTAQYTHKGKPIRNTVVRVLDLCAGSAVWGIVAKQELEKLGFEVHLTAIEIDETILPAPEVDDWITDDFRNVKDCGEFDYIFSNPPFSLVYEITMWSIERLTDWGIFTLLIGSNFLFAEKDGSALLSCTSPLFEIKLTRRPSFKYTFARKRKDKKGKGTSAKDYTTYFFGGRSLLNELQFHQRDVNNFLSLPETAKTWPTYTQHWDYEEDPLDAILVERPVTVQQALIREAAEASGFKIKFDHPMALLAANRYGWDFFNATTLERLDMLDRMKEERVIYTIGHTKNYIEAMRRTQGGVIYKLGRDSEKGYEGGCAFKTQEDAQRCIDEKGFIGYSVFGLAANWERDTVESSTGIWHNLLVDAEVFCLDNIAYEREF